MTLVQRRSLLRCCTDNIKRDLEHDKIHQQLDEATQGELLAGLRKFEQTADAELLQVVKDMGLLHGAPAQKQAAFLAKAKELYPSHVEHWFEVIEECVGVSLVQDPSEPKVRP